MNAPTICPDCLEIVDFEDMVDVAECGAAIFICPDCADPYITES